MTIDPMDTFSFMLGYHRVRGRLGLSEAGMPLMRHRVRPPEDERRLKSWNVEIPTQIDLSDHVMEEVEPGRFRFHRRPLRLITVLSIFRALDATDPRDKIFAFLNLATDNLSLLPDYTIDVQEVFRRAAETIMTATGTLSVLSQVQDPQDTKIQGLPSWVPDFSVRIQRAPFDEGDEGCQFRASSWSNPVKMVFNADGTLTVDGFRVGAVCSVINLDQDPVMEVLKLALKVPPEYPGHPRGWWHLTNGEGGGRRALRARVMNRVEALWRTLIADNLTETEEESEEVGSRARFGGGFASWILADILEARSFFVQEVQDSNPISWLEQLTGASFLTRMFLWSAIYDGHQVPNFSFSNMSIEDMLSDLENKEAEERDQYQLDQYLGISSPRVGVEHLPTAHQIKAPFYKPRRDEMQDREEKANYHRSNALSRLDPAEIRRLHIFEAHMNRVTEGRLLFYTDRGMFGLGPKSTNLEAQCTDEIWILNGAKVPFILRWDAGMRYKIVGEAYVHGVMHGEETGVMKEIHII
ncbi:hypothetical protein BX600DRAFT_457272 [Xylariales sp. PMI_506]|nr:hypothetical protein BX600DRAFT_457272 [Xylariales sp. PMI_506]